MPDGGGSFGVRDTCVYQSDVCVYGLVWWVCGWGLGRRVCGDCGTADQGDFDARNDSSRVGRPVTSVRKTVAPPRRRVADRALRQRSR